METCFVKTLSMVLATSLLPGGAATAAAPVKVPIPGWTHLSSRTGDLPEPNGGTEQTACVTFDVDGDGKTDLLAGQFWFRHRGGGEAFEPIPISDRPGRVRAGHFMPGKVAQIVYSSGDGDGPLRLYACQGDPADPHAWVPRTLLEREVLSGHTLEVGDIDGDGNLDIFCAEMHTPGPGARCRAWILYGDGQGSFRAEVLSTGLCNHDSRLADVNGDGRLDIVSKPYTWDTPRLDVWLNQGPVP